MLASRLSVPPSLISQWASGSRPVPPARCPDIERLTGGEVTCEELCPDVDWAYLRGRPGAIAVETADPDAGRIVPVESA